jgi:hypothetical protein
MKINLKTYHYRTINRQNIHSAIEDPEILPVSERNNAGLKKLSSSV